MIPMLTLGWELGAGGACGQNATMSGFLDKLGDKNNPFKVSGRLGVDEGVRRLTWRGGGGRPAAVEEAHVCAVGHDALLHEGPDGPLRVPPSLRTSESRG
jgi:hypothetical protein